MPFNWKALNNWEPGHSNLLANLGWSIKKHEEVSDNELG